jgi:hypothetical protein
MTGAPLLLTELLTECDTHGIRLMLDGDGGLVIDAPQHALTPELLGRLKDSKADLLVLLRTPSNVATDSLSHVHGPVKNVNPLASTTKLACRCGSTTWRDVPIHDGQSFRRDCGRCGRFLDFPVWYGSQYFALCTAFGTMLV